MVEHLAGSSPLTREDKPPLTAFQMPPGSSPLTRGKRAAHTSVGFTDGLIPAHAGKTRPARASPLWRAAYPHSRGENATGMGTDIVGAGSSPLTRGKHGAEPGESLDQGLIPARAGKTDEEPRRGGAQRAHPRSRGENVPVWFRAVSGRGSSPLARGKLASCSFVSTRPRLIPAHAGKTGSLTPHSASQRAHPRSRGENRGRGVWLLLITGSSPLTRGKPTSGSSAGERERLIPAHAGKTVDRAHARGAVRAHPRSRGENAPSGRRLDRPSGSSPLTRGKLCETGRREGRVVAHPRSRGENL